MASQPSREEAASSRKWRKPQECFQKEGWASRPRRNAQARTLLRGRGRAKGTVGAEESLQKGHLSPPPLQAAVPWQRTALAPVAPTGRTPTSPWPYQLPRCRCETCSCPWGGVGPGRGSSGSRAWSPGASPAPFTPAHPGQGAGGGQGLPLTSRRSEPGGGTLTSRLLGHERSGKRSPRPKGEKGTV